MRRIFIDGGANIGNSIEMFLAKYPNAEEYQIHSFECNPELFSQLEKYKGKAILYKDALSTREGEAQFNLGEELSSTLRSDKVTGRIDYTNPIRVPLVDLAKFIKKNFSQQDYIILKLDVEGSEYDILPHLLKENIFDGWVDELFGEWHVGKLSNISKEAHLDLVYQLYKKGVKMKEWCAESNTIELG